jgi:hypothetical protein
MPESNVARLKRELSEARAAEKSAKRASKPKRTPLADRPVAPMTTGVSMERRVESFGGKSPWGVDHAFLRFHGDDNVAHPIGSKLDTNDTAGLELVQEIKDYAKANRVGNSKVRFDPSLGAWKGRADMFPPRLRTIAGYEIKK